MKKILLLFVVPFVVIVVLLLFVIVLFNKFKFELELLCIPIVFGKILAGEPPFVNNFKVKLILIYNLKLKNSIKRKTFQI